MRLIFYFVGEKALSASLVAKLFFDNVVRFFGVPAGVISDRDPRFTASFWQKLWALLGTKLLMSSAYHPQMDGQMERTRSTLEQTLRCLLSEGGLDGSQWYTLLP